MKHKALYIATIIFFLLVNTTYFWESKMGVLAMITFALLILFYLVLAALLLFQTFIAIREKFEKRQRLYLVGLMTVVLVSTYFNPGGLVSFENFESDSLLTAQREGVANCMTTLKLRDDKTFIEKNVCFGVTETKGTYSLKGDTIFFKNVSLGSHESDFYKFAVIKTSEYKSEKYLGDLVRYKDYSDTTGMTLWIIKNQLTK